MFRRDYNNKGRLWNILNSLDFGISNLGRHCLSRANKMIDDTIVVKLKILITSYFLCHFFGKIIF